MSGRAHLAPAGTLTEIPVFAMDATSGEGVLGIDPADAGFSARYRRAGETSDTTMTLTAVAVDAAIAANQWRDYGDGAYTIVGPAALYASGVRFAKVTLDCGTPPALADVVFLFLGPDPLGPVATESGIATATVAELAGTGGAAARTAIATAVDGAVADNFAAIAASVDSALTDNFAALPAAIVTALLSAADGQAWGVQSTPSGGSSVVWPVRRGGTLIGNRTLYYSSAGAVVGWTAVA